MKTSVHGLILKADPKNYERIYHTFTLSDACSRHGRLLYDITFVTVNCFGEPYPASFIPIRTRLTEVGIRRKITSKEYGIMSKEEFAKLKETLEGYKEWSGKSLEAELKRTFDDL